MRGLHPGQPAFVRRHVRVAPVLADTVSGHQSYEEKSQELDLRAQPGVLIELFSKPLCQHMDLLQPSSTLGRGQKHGESRYRYRVAGYSFVCQG